MIIPSIMNAFRRATFLSVALELRGYSYDIAHRTYWREFKMDVEDYLGLASVAILAIIGVLSLPYFLGFGRAGKVTLPIILKLFDMLGIKLPTV